MTFDLMPLRDLEHEIGSVFSWLLFFYKRKWSFLGMSEVLGDMTDPLFVSIEVHSNIYNPTTTNLGPNYLSV